MKMKIITIGIITILALIPSALSISAHYIKPTNSSTDIAHIKCNSNNLDSAVIGGNVLGLIFDIQAYVICEGMDKDFHDECWESTTDDETGFKFYVPIPEDQDHYRITAKKYGYRSKTIDVYLSPEESIIYKDISLFPEIKTKLPLFVFISFIYNLFS